MVFKQFSDDFKPEKILHRDSQIKIINDVFLHYKQYQMASNLVIMGVTGSGKTSTIKHLIQKNDNSYYIMGKEMKKTYEIWRQLVNSKARPDLLLGLAMSLIEKNPKILIIDEINKITDMEVLYNDLNSIYRATGVPIILISNKVNILEKIPDDARLTLFLERVSFPSYNASELKDIALDRISTLDNDLKEMITEGSLNLICALASKEGSARLMISLIRRCLIAHDFSQKKIDEFLKSDEQLEWESFIESLSDTEKEFLKILVDLFCEYEGTNKNITTYIVRQKMPNLSPSRVSQLITLFEKDYGVIKSRYLHTGRAGGKYRIIDFMDMATFNKICSVVP